VQLLHDWIASLPPSGETPVATKATRDTEAAAIVTVQDTASDDARTHSLTTLLSSTSGALQLMWAIDAGRVPEATRRAAILQANASPDAHIRDLFEKYLPEEQRPKRLGNAIQLEAILALNGDASRGRKLFFDTEGIQCKTCHKIGGQGADVGPDLSQIGKKYDRAKILDNILTPSREIDPKFVVYLAALNDGRVQTGLLVERTEQAISLKDNKGKVSTLALADIEQLAPQQQSLMPDLLLRDMTAEQVADLLAYLSTLQ
jgi:putative heme-binding domain-containing protein